jgi:hypothetical protein
MIAYAVALALNFGIAAQPAAQAAAGTTPTEVPADIEVPAGFKPFLEGHAVGTQNYICAPTAAGLKWLFIGPQATVFDENGRQFLTHFQSINFQGDAIQATWQHSRDTSAVWARKRTGSTDPYYVAPDAIEWLLLEVTGATPGPTDGDKLVPTMLIQRVNTAGGKEPSFPCTAAIVNQRELVPYEADYIFFRRQGGHR